MEHASSLLPLYFGENAILNCGNWNFFAARLLIWGKRYINYFENKLIEAYLFCEVQWKTYSIFLLIYFKNKKI